MGQPHSKPDYLNMKGLQVPSDWKNDANFQVVSPVSDISNPSQMRKQTAVPSSRRMNRTSKVCPRSRPPTGLPPPKAFYFNTIEEEPSEPSGKALGNFKAKCSKAKKMLGDCLFQQPPPPPPPQQQKKVHQKHPLDTRRQSKRASYEHSAYMQFDPVWKENLPNESASPKLKASKLFTDDAPLEHVRKVGSHHLDSERKSVESSQGPSVLDRVRSLENQRNIGSSRILESRSFDSSKTGSQATIQRSKSVDTMDEIKELNPRETSDIFRKVPIHQASRRSNSRLKASIERSFSEEDEGDVRKMSIQQSFQRQIDANPRVTRLRQSHQDNLQRHLKQTRSFDDGLQLRAEKHQAMTDKVRKTKSVDETELYRRNKDKKSRHPKSHSSKNKMSSRTSKSLSMEEIEAYHRHKQSLIQRSRTVDDDEVRRKLSSHKTLKRSSSVPGRAAQAGRRVSMAPSQRTNRSTSNPRPSIDGSALLHLTGWKAKEKNQSKPMPALLKMAGWKEHDKSESRALVVVPKPKNRKSVDSEIEAALASRKSIVEAKKNTSGRASVSTAPVRVPMPESQHQLPRHEPALVDPTKGKTIARILQQAYFQDEEIYNAEPEASEQTMPSREIPKNENLPLVEFSPAPTVDSKSTGPLVSNQANENSEFLFSDATEILTEPSKKDECQISISTLDSRKRMVAMASKPVTIPPPAANQLVEDSTRRVRFSHDVTVDPATDGNNWTIESKLSDLTDSTGLRDCNETKMLEIPRIDSIPEESEEDESEIHPDGEEEEAEEEETVIAAEKECVQPVYKETIVPANPPPMVRWSYRNEDGLTKGATPVLIKKTSKSHEPTNSPYLRFKQAQDLFNAAESGTKKDDPPKRTGRSSSLVTSRIAAMERRQSQYDDIIPPSDQLRAPAMNEPSKIISSLSMKTVDSYPLMMTTQSNTVEEATTTCSVVSNDDSEEDAFGDILHPTTLDEDSTECDRDEFNELLNYSGSEDESELQPTVSTVVRDRFSISSTVFSDATQSTVLQGGRQLSYGDDENKQVAPVQSAVSRMQKLPFRAGAPVKPTGSPAPARAWRVLAAANSSHSRPPQYPKYQ